MTLLFTEAFVFVCSVVITVLREEVMETVCQHFGSTLLLCLEVAARGKTTSTALGKKHT